MVRSLHGARSRKNALNYQAMKDVLQYEIAKSREFDGHWHVEAIGPDGEVYVAIFTGPNAKERADEYAEWKNARQSAAVLETV